MKTFQEFLEEANLIEETALEKAFTRAGANPSVGDWEPRKIDILAKLRRTIPSDRAKPTGHTGGVAITPLNQATYHGRVAAGRNPKFQENPDYIGPLRFAGRGTKDTRMPGTTPSYMARFPKFTEKRLKPVPTTSKIISTPTPKPKKPNYSNFI